jgi:hypothetical protein
VVANFRPAISLPFIVFTIFGCCRVTTWPLDVGLSDSNVMCRSVSGCAYNAVRSIRFVVGIWPVVSALCCVLSGIPVCWVVCPRNSAAISICYCIMVVTSLDCFVVVVGGSSCSSWRILFLMVSIL